MDEIIKQILDLGTPNEIRPKTAEKESVSPPPQIPQRSAIHGAELTDEQDKAFMNGECIYLEGMDRQDGKGKFSSYVFSDDAKKLIFYSNENPDNFVKYGKYEMRLRDKLQVKAGLVTRAKIKWWDIGSFAHPYLWRTEKDNPGEYQESWNDPHIPKEVHEKEMREFDRRIRQNIPPPKKNGPKLR